MRSIDYRPEIDGLRALAVMPVILFHLGITSIPGGFLGVDVFFVISGYLITSIIQAELEAGTFTFRGFYARRIRRIMPALLVVLASTMVAGWLLLSRVEYPIMGRDALATLLGVANISFFMNHSGYWGQAANELLFLHTWSLSVEEQYYFCFPLIFWLFARFRWPGLRLLVSLLIVSSLFLFMIGNRTAPVATFYLLPPRAWELATGALLAMVGRKCADQPPRQFLASSLGLIGLIMILAAYSLATRPGIRTIPAVLGTAMVIRFARTGAAHALFSQWAMIHIGKLSYSLYLWHWPLLVFFRKMEWMTPVVLMIGLTYMLSLATYHLVEQPCRRGGKSLSRIGLGYLATLGLACGLAFSNGTYDTSEFEKPEWLGVCYSASPNQFTPEDFKRVYEGCSVPDSRCSPSAYKSGGIIVGPGDSPPRIVILGDSHGCMWSGAIQHVTDQLGIKTSFWSIDGVDALINIPVTLKPATEMLSSEQKFEYDQSRLDLIKQWQPDLVIFCSRWSGWGGKRTAEVQNLLDYLTHHSSQVLIMEQPPVLNIGNQSLLQYLCYKHIKPVAGVRRYLPGIAVDSQGGQGWIRDVISQFSNCAIIPTFDLYVQGSEVLCLDGRKTVFLDDDHLTTYGASLAIPRLEQAIHQALDIKPDSAEIPSASTGTKHQVGPLSATIGQN